MAVLGLMSLAPAANPSPLDINSPSISYTITGISGTNGWYRGSSGGEYVVIHWAITDPGSQVDSTSGCELAVRVDGPTTGTRKTCTATLIDNSQISLTTSPIKVDNEPPIGVSANARVPDHGAWYNQPVEITWKGSDATSGIDSCRDLIYSGPDTGSAARGGACTDGAGNVSGTVTYSLKYDTTAPTVTTTADHQPNGNGWYKDPVKVTWSGSDATSGVAAGDCTAPVTYSGPDSSGVSRSGTCTDRAGNQSASASFALKYDTTAPTVTATPDHQPNTNGWYKDPVKVTWSGSDTTSGIASCPNSATYSTPDSANAALSAICTDQAGNSSSTSFPLKYDSTLPVAGSASPARPPDVNGWYNHQVSLNWSGSDATSGPASCTSLSYNGPDGSSVAPSGTCTDQAGNTSTPLTLPSPIQFDATAPTEIRAAPARGPDHNGWYTQPVAITWSGSDPTSGIAGCSSLTYSGPDSGSAGPTGGCTDKAGNTASATF